MFHWFRESDDMTTLGTLSQQIGNLLSLWQRESRPMQDKESCFFRPFYIGGEIIFNEIQGNILDFIGEIGFVFLPTRKSLSGSLDETIEEFDSIDTIEVTDESSGINLIL
jgi:hypothetical protein